MRKELKDALNDPIYKNHKIGETYSMTNANGKKDNGKWKISYYPLFGTYKGDEENKEWLDFEEPRALVEKPIDGGIDFREVPLRYLIKNS